MSDYVIQINEPESYSLEVGTSAEYNNNIVVEVSGGTTVDVLSNQIDYIIQTNEPESYSLQVDTSDEYNNNIIVEVSGGTTVDVLSNQIVFVKDLPEGYPLSWTSGPLPASRVSGSSNKSNRLYLYQCG